MDDNLNNETYFYLSSKSLIISILDDQNKKIYFKKVLINKKDKEKIFEDVDSFLNENIIKIEKDIQNFIKKIIIILDLDEFFPIEISVKNKNYKNIVDLNNLNYLLYDAKEYCKKTIDKKKILHMIIDSYNIDGINYSYFPEDEINGHFSLDIKFICVSDEFIAGLEKILRKYHISLSQVVCADYIDHFLTDNEEDIFLMSKKIINGHNPNEVMLVNKNVKNQGFFEKFFNFFN